MRFGLYIFENSKLNQLWSWLFWEDSKFQKLQTFRKIPEIPKIIPKNPKILKSPQHRFCSSLHCLHLRLFEFAPIAFCQFLQRTEMWQWQLAHLRLESGEGCWLFAKKQSAICSQFHSAECQFPTHEQRISAKWFWHCLEKSCTDVGVRTHYPKFQC